MPSDDEQAIFNETAAFAEVWNQGDAQAAAAFYTEDGARVGAFGDVQHGRPAIAAAYDRLWHQTMPASSRSAAKSAGCRRSWLCGKPACS